MEHPSCTIAWEGWTLPAWPAWRPVSVEGDRRRGRMLVGSAEQGVMLVQWWRPGESAFDFGRWLRARLEQVAKGMPLDPSPPVPGGFRAAASLMGRTFGGGVSKSVWYGHAPADDLVLEITVNDAAETTAALVKRAVLPAIGVRPFSGYVPWSVFGVAFEAPPGYALKRRILQAGDMALEFSAAGRRTLLLRQVYPAEAALAKRPLDRWLAAAPFAQQRRLTEMTQEPVVLGGRRALTGLARRGWKRHAFPLERFRPLRDCSLAVVDAALDRILIAELTGGDEHGEDLVRRAVERMNGSLREGYGSGDRTETTCDQSR